MKTSFKAIFSRRFWLSLSIFILVLIVILIVFSGITVNPHVNNDFLEIPVESTVNSYSSNIISTTSSIGRVSIPTLSITPSPTSYSRISETLLISTPSSVNFQIPTSQRTTPEDILKEVKYSPSGGGAFSPCNDYDLLSKSPVISVHPKQVELMREIYIEICGWKLPQTVHITIQTPKGQIFSSDENIKETAIYHSIDTNSINPTEFKVGYISSSYKLGLDDLTGTYIFTFTGREATFQESVEVTKPIGPKWFWLARNKQWLLYNFKPNENVRLFTYESVAGQIGIYRLFGWQKYQTDVNGQLLISRESISDASINVIVGDISGVLYSDRRMGKIIRQPTNVPCNKDSPTRISTGDTVRVSYDKLDETLLSQAEFRSPTITSVLGGASMHVMDGPKRNDEAIWWRVQVYGVDGWMVECSGGSYSLEPLNQPAIVLTNPSTSTRDSIVCFGAPPVRVQSGSKARITYTNGVSVRVRNAPGLKSNILLLLPEGTVFSVIDGPRCQDNGSWWNIKLDNGATGWVMEGEAGNYYVEPWK